jgi:hypothetical protein
MRLHLLCQLRQAVSFCPVIMTYGANAHIAPYAADTTSSLVPQLLFVFMARQPLVGLGLFIVEVSQSHSDTPDSVGLFWTSDRSVAETST